jgi:hypothetical protein
LIKEKETQFLIHLCGRQAVTKKHLPVNGHEKGFNSPEVALVIVKISFGCWQRRSVDGKQYLDLEMIAWDDWGQYFDVRD